MNAEAQLGELYSLFSCVEEVENIFREADPELHLTAICGWLSAPNDELMAELVGGELAPMSPLVWLSINDPENVYTAARHAAAPLAW